MDQTQIPASPVSEIEDAEDRFFAALRDADAGQPDTGALPQGAEAWRIGIDGRLSLFGP